MREEEMPPPETVASGQKDVQMKEPYTCRSHDLLHAIIGPISLFERQ